MRRTFSLAALLLVSLVALVVACESVRSYVYTGQKYEPESGCLDGYTAVEIVPGEGVSGTCAPICFTVGTTLYLSTVCPPLPSVATAVPADAAACLAALDAAAQEASCPASAGDDGGGDGGDDGGGDAAQDTGQDTGADAPFDAPEAG